MILGGHIYMYNVVTKINIHYIFCLKLKAIISICNFHEVLFSKMY